MITPESLVLSPAKLGFMFMAGQFGPILPYFQTSRMALAILGFDRPVLAPDMTVIANMLTYSSFQCLT